MTFFKGGGKDTYQDIFNSVGVKVYIETKMRVHHGIRAQILIASYDPLTEGVFGPLHDASQAMGEDALR